MFRTIDNPVTRNEFLVLWDELETSQRILEKCWDIAEKWCMDRDIDDQATIVAVAIRVWAQPSPGDVSHIYQHAWSDAERFGVDIDEFFAWAGMKFTKLAESGFNLEARNFIENLVCVDDLIQEEDSVQVRKQDIGQKSPLP